MILINAANYGRRFHNSSHPSFTKFYLLSENIEDIFKKVEADDPKRAMSLKLLSMVCAATEEQAGFNIDEYVSESIKPYIIEKATTDSNGNAEFHTTQKETPVSIRNEKTPIWLCCLEQKNRKRRTKYKP